MATASQRSGGALLSLARFGFTDLEGTIPKLDELVSLVGDVGRSALAALAKVASPDDALTNLIALARIDKTKVKKLLGKEDSAERLAKLVGASTALNDFLARTPENLVLFEKQVTSLPSRQDYDLVFTKSLEALKGKEFNSASLVTSLRVLYRTELLRIAIYDLSQQDPQQAQPRVSLALADLAGSALEAGVYVARRELTESTEFGTFTNDEVNATTLAVIGMGKGGAGELNYISDVDVIYVAEAKDDTVDKERMLAIATKLATRMMRAMDGNNPEPALWQVDANLRPEGKSGALVRTLDSHQAYYARWAENWEFQALLKARPMAGDRELGERYFAAVQPLVWQSTQRENFVESVQRMRERVTSFIPDDEIDRQIKLGVGGLRDIEFTVQLLQLVHGRTDESVRAADTVTAIGQLAAGGYIGRSEANEFSQHYKFLRLIEHRIQMTQMRRTHLMPLEENARRAIARSVNISWTAEELMNYWSEVKQQVRALHQKIFYRPLLAAVSKASDGLELTNDQAADRLSVIGFIDPKGALVHISALTSGLSRRAQIQKQLLPVLIQWFAEGTDPDAALLAFRRLSENLGESHWYLRMLRDSSGSAERMTVALSSSRLATAMLELIPEGAAWFEDVAQLQPQSLETLRLQSESLGSRHEEIEEFAKAVRHIRRRETLRLALGAVVGELNLEQLAVGLTDITQWYLESITTALIESMKHNDVPVAELLDFGIVAMGRFGGAELGFGSDADLMYVYDPKPAVPVAIAQKAAELVIAEIKRLSTDPQLEFELDMDLRPEGRNGSVARSLESYKAYYSRWGDIWENQALLRARMIYGSETLREGFSDVVDAYRYPENLESKSIIEIRRIKARVENERLPQGADPKRHLKLGRGSLSDIEWLVQLLQLKHGNEHPSIRTPRTLEALRALVEAKLIEAHDARVLEEAWLLTSRIRSASVLWSNKRSDVLPTDRRQLEGMARILEYPRGSASKLEEDYLAFTRRSRMVFERLFFA
jgi:glutamate-ammonia-ligase adenylyltransferase